MKNKGFTVVELVIAVAVTAILAAVTVPVLSGVIESANISADTQTVRNMNVILESESADGNVPTGGPEVIDILKENGFTKFRPQTKFYTFYWLIKQNVIILANEAGDPVYPEEYAEERYDDQNWVNLEDPRLPPAPSETPETPREFTVSLRISGASGLVFDKIPSTVTEGEKLDLIFEIPKDMQIRYRIKNITVLMEDGEETHKIDAPQGSQLDGAFIVGEIPTVNIPCVTGNIEINVSIQEYCLVTIKGTNSEHMKKEEFRIWFQKGMRLHISRSLLEKEALNEGYRITSATASKGEHSLGEVFDPEINSIHARNINVTSDIDIVITTEWITHTVKLIVKDQHGTELLSHEANVYYDTEIDDVAYSFPMPAALADKEFEITSCLLNPAITNEKMKPVHQYDSEQFTVNVSNIKSDFVLTYIVKVPE